MMLQEGTAVASQNAVVADVSNAGSSLLLHQILTNNQHHLLRLLEFRTQFVLRYVEPILLTLFDNADNTDTDDYDYDNIQQEQPIFSLEHLDYDNHLMFLSDSDSSFTQHRRRLGFLPSYVSNVNSWKETSMSFATLIMLFVTLSSVFIIFLSCFYHNLKTSPIFVSPRKHRLPKLVPPALPVNNYLSWVKVIFLLSDEEIINRIGYDALVFIRFHRLALRCIVKMSIFSFVVLLPLNFTGGGHANAQDLKEYVGSLFFTDFLRFTMANVQGGAPRLWIHCFAAYLLTAIVIRELLREYETFNSIRHRYLLSREPHLRTVFVTNIPRHLRSTAKIDNYFKNVYPGAVRNVFICQNLLQLEQFVQQRTMVLSKIEQELLLLCRVEKKKLYQQTFCKKFIHAVYRKCHFFDDCCGYGGTQERLTTYYGQLETLNNDIEKEQRRRRRVMGMMDRMDARGDGAHDIDYVLASPFYVVHEDPVTQKRTLGVSKSSGQQPTSSGSINTNYEPPSEVRNATGTGSLRARSPVLVGKSTKDETSGITASTMAAQQQQQHSQQEPDGLMKTDHDDGLDVVEDGKIMGSNSKKKKKRRKDKTFSRARRAIRRYGRFSSNSETSFLGKPIPTAGNLVHDNDGIPKMEDHINEVTDKAFVIMRTFTAATIAIQSMHSSKPGAMQVTTAPEPRDILWNNIYMSKGAHRTRSYLGEFLVLLIVTLYVVPVAMVSLLVSESALISSSPRLAQLAQASAFFSAVIALVQPLCIVGLQQLLPPLFVAIGKAEGITAFSEVQMRAFSRYFLFQVINIFLVTTIAGSIFDTIAIIIENPEAAFEMLGNSLPRMSSFFITFVTIKTFLGVGVELVRVMCLVQATTRTVLFPNATLRTKRKPFLAMRSIDDPGWFPFHKILAQDMLVVVISVVFAVVAPLVLLPCALFCLFARLLWTHHLMYVYESVFESGGQFWPKIFRRFVFGLITAQATITGQFILKEARHQAYASIALMFMTYFFLRSTRARYDPTSKALPLEVATVMDISLRDTDDDDRTEAESSAAGPAAKPPATTTLSPREEEDHGMIGQYDPFQMAYIQPALRANPRARPEQPFPAAQLGPDDSILRATTTANALMTTTGGGGGGEESVSTESGWHNSGATVRLKSMNQQDRRLIDRWWNDQLQKAGEQNILSILVGEECGTLTLSGPGNTAVELTETSSYPDSSVAGSSFV